MFFISTIIVSPLATLKSAFGTSDGRLRLFRVAMCIGVFVGLMFWSSSQKPTQQEAGEYAVENDKLLQLLSPLNQLLLDNYQAVPYVSTYFLCIVYMLLFTLLVRYISEGDHIFPEVVTDWGIALLLTLVTKVPLSKTAVRYYDDLYYPFEYYASDSVVSWHMLVLIVSSRYLLLRYASVLMLVSFLILYFGFALFLLAARVTYSPAIVFAVLIALFGARVRDFIIEKITKKLNGPSIKSADEIALAPEFTIQPKGDGTGSDIDFLEEKELQDM